MMTRVAMGVLVVVVTLVVVGVTVEIGSTLLSMRSAIAPLVGFILLCLVAPCVVIVGIWMFKKSVL
jgi:hypothetical protein